MYHQTFPEALSNFPDLLSTLSPHLNQCWCYNRDSEWEHKAQDDWRAVLEVTFCPEYTLYAGTSSFPQFAVLACIQLQEGNLRPVTKETKQVLPWVILSLEGVWVSFLWWKLRGWLIYFVIHFNTQGLKHWLQIKPYIPPTTRAGKSRKWITVAAVWGCRRIPAPFLGKEQRGRSFGRNRWLYLWAKGKHRWQISHLAQWKEPEKGLGMGPDVKLILSCCAKSYRTASSTQAVNPDKRQDLEKGQRRVGGWGGVENRGNAI